MSNAALCECGDHCQSPGSLCPTCAWELRRERDEAQAELAVLDEAVRRNAERVARAGARSATELSAIISQGRHVRNARAKQLLDRLAALERVREAAENTVNWWDRGTIDQRIQPLADALAAARRRSKGGAQS